MLNVVGRLNVGGSSRNQSVCTGDERVVESTNSLAAGATYKWTIVDHAGIYSPVDTEFDHIKEFEKRPTQTIQQIIDFAPQVFNVSKYSGQHYP